MPPGNKVEDCKQSKMVLVLVFKYVGYQRVLKGTEVKGLKREKDIELELKRIKTGKTKLQKYSYYLSKEPYLR